MQALNHPLFFARIALILILASVLDAAQQPAGLSARSSWVDLQASHVVLPQARAWSVDPARDPILIEGIQARIEILEQVATTHLQIELSNPGTSPAEAVLLLPVPDGAAVSGFDFDGAGSEPSARLLGHDEARRTYDEIVATLRDPALLEFAGYSLLRSSVFPVEGGGRQRVRLTYTHVLEQDGERVDYCLPRSESLAVDVPWDIEVELRSAAPISTVYSPSHGLETERAEGGRLRIRIVPEGRRNPGPFLLSYLRQKGEVSATLFAYPDPTLGGGHFLLVAGLPARIADAERRVLREVTIVLDRSGSMVGEKMEQARAAALQVIEGLEPGEAFNLIDYSSQAARFAPRSVLVGPNTRADARAYLESLRPNGGTNIGDALVEALRSEPREDMLGLVLFLTDGLPTVGVTSEVELAEAVRAANGAGRRVYTFGVGEDVNAPLLDRISGDTRGTTEYVLPGEDVELAVAGVFQKLYGPVLADLELEVLDEEGGPDTRSVRELMPRLLPDLFEGDSLVLLGQYRGEGPLNLRLRGDFLGSEREFAFRFALDRASTRNAFVPRLWATRKIAFLAEEIRQAGAVLSASQLAGRHDLMADRRYAELGEEILRLSTRYGVLSEYTAFLATEGTDLASWEGLVMDCNLNLNDRAVLTRSGGAAVNQGRNFKEQVEQVALKYDNGLWNDRNERVEFAGVQQVSDRAFFKRGPRWIDAQLVGDPEAQAPDVEVELGSEQHRAILEALVAEGRQALLSLPGEILLCHAGQNVLIHNDIPITKETIR